MQSLLPQQNTFLKCGLDFYCRLMVILLPPVPGPKIKGIDPVLLQV